MKALILVGGYGTRLRPLTLSVPKPLINFCNKSIVEYQVASFKRAGVEHLILAVAYQPEALMEALRALESKYCLTISCSKEDEPLGTAGPIRLAKDLLVGATNEAAAKTAAEGAAAKTAALREAAKLGPPTKPGSTLPIATTSLPRFIAQERDCFFVCNSDIICSFPFEAMWSFHKCIGAEATILVTHMSDPSGYGVVVHEEDGRVHEFVEKPTHFVGNWINAGVYILNINCIDRIKAGRCSIEKEVFPQMAADGSLFCYRLQGYWADIGQPRDFLEGMSLYLQHLRCHREARQGPPVEGPSDSQGPPGAPKKEMCGEAGVRALACPENLEETEAKAKGPLLMTMPSQELSLLEGPHITGNVLVDPTAIIGEGTVLGPNVSIDRDVVIGKGCRLQNCAIMSGVVVSDFSWIASSILGWQSSIGKWVRVEGITVVGENVHIQDECFVNGAYILPHKTITESISKPGAIIM